MSHDQKPTKMRIVASAGEKARRTGDPAESGSAALAEGPPPPASAAAAGGMWSLGLICLLFVGGSAVGGVALSLLRLS